MQLMPWLMLQLSHVPYLLSLLQNVDNSGNLNKFQLPCTDTQTETSDGPDVECFLQVSSHILTGLHKTANYIKLYIRHSTVLVIKKQRMYNKVRCKLDLSSCIISLNRRLTKYIFSSANQRKNHKIHSHKLHIHDKLRFLHISSLTRTNFKHYRVIVLVLTAVKYNSH